MGKTKSLADQLRESSPVLESLFTAPTAVDQLWESFPVLASLFTALTASPTGEALDTWVYNQDFATLGALIGEWHPIMEGCELFDEPFEGDGHNGFEEFTIAVLVHHMGKYQVWDGKNFRPEQLNQFIEAWSILNDGVDDFNNRLDDIKYEYENPE